jgi:hypothetical protein
VTFACSKCSEALIPDVSQDAFRCVGCGTFYSHASLASQPRSNRQLRAEPIRGWRIWKVLPTEHTNMTYGQLKTLIETARLSSAEEVLRVLFSPYLAGVGHSIPWHGPIYEARCASRPHKPPVYDCGCGVWILKDTEYMRKVLNNYWHEGVLMALGEVQGWGRFVEHSKGWRVQFARPLSITILSHRDICKDDQKEMEWLSKKWGCPVDWQVLSPVLRHFGNMPLARGATAVRNPLPGHSGSVPHVTTTFTTWGSSTSWNPSSISWTPSNISNPTNPWWQFWKT